jgi:AcrR family transcriptional regulator
VPQSRADERSGAEVQPAEVQPAEVQPAEVQPAEVQPDKLLPGELAPPPTRTPRTGRTAQIVSVARRVLEAEGPEALTMRRLGSELGIQAPSIYKHFSGKPEVEMALIEEALAEFGDVSHRVLHDAAPEHRIMRLLDVYRRHALEHASLYRLATSGPLRRDRLPHGLEEWAGNPWFVVTGDESLAQALWSFAHGMVILELDGRYPPGSDLDKTWRAGAQSFERAAAQGFEPTGA